MGALMAVLTALASAEEPERVVSIGGSVTEIVYRLDRSDQLVAVDSTSTYPAPAAELPDVGYMRQLSAEPILSLDPDHVIVAADAGPPVVFEKLRSADVPVTRVADEPSPAGVIDKVSTVATTLGAEEEGEALAERLKTRFDALERAMQTVDDRPSAEGLPARSTPTTGVGPPWVGRNTRKNTVLYLNINDVPPNWTVTHVCTISRVDHNRL